MTDDPREPTDPELEALLFDERPLPRPAFRGELRRALLRDTGAIRPRGVRLAIAAYASAGSAILAAVTIGIAGAGPFAP